MGVDGGCGNFENDVHCCARASVDSLTHTRLYCVQITHLVIHCFIVRKSTIFLASSISSWHCKNTLALAAPDCRWVCFSQQKLSTCSVLLLVLLVVAGDLVHVSVLM